MSFAKKCRLRDEERGTCNYGYNCRYSHELPNTDDKENGLQGAEIYADWRQSLRLVRSVFSTSSDLWTRAIMVLETDCREWQQSLARDLVDDGYDGLKAVKQTIRASMDQGDDVRCLRSAEPFLKVITHPSLLHSLSVDTYLGTIYRFLGGINGEQGIAFLANISRRLTAVFQTKNDHFTSAELIELFSLTVVALHELLHRERKALFDDTLQKLFDTLMALHSQLQQASPAPELSIVFIQLDSLRRMASGAPQLQSQATTAWASMHTGSYSRHARSTFPMDVTAPGGNHDNDFPSISRIQILPTLDEIASEYPEYLPSTDFLQPHHHSDPAQRHLDTAFRLLRYDIFGPLKEVLGSMLSQNVEDANPFKGGKVQGHVYQEAGVQHIYIREKFGLEATISFRRPSQIRNRSLSDQRRWWKESSRLDPGGLICFVSEPSVSGDRSIVFFITTTKNTEHKKDDREKSALVSKDHQPTISVKLASGTEQDLALLCRMHVGKVRGQLIEIPGIIPDTFMPVLKNLQQMAEKHELAFRRWILPNVSDSEAELHPETPPPAYARRPGFQFRLNSITRSGADNLSLDPASQAPDKGVDLARFESCTGLNRSQSQALIAALTREYAMIQGPPGTGKSYVGVQLVRALLAHQVTSSLGPILIICYTNHALDQFLQHLMKEGIEKIIRIGGQSRAEELEGKNLRVVSRTIPKTRVEEKLLGSTYQSLENCFGSAGNSLKQVHQAKKTGPKWDLLKAFLTKEHPQIFRQLRPQDDDGFTRVGGNPFDIWLGKRPAAWGTQEGRPSGNIDSLTRRALADVHALTPRERWVLADDWLARVTESQSARLSGFIDEAKKRRQTINNVHAEVDRRAVEQAHVVGVTTTGLARNISMLRRVEPKVIICEEAAEVMEAHLISAMMPGVEHFIQIGDHRQLRPRIQNYLQFSMETKTGEFYQLDRSQFERRAVGEPALPPLPVAQLTVQFRMRPEISRLIRGIYPDLEDHETVKKLPSVVGMRNNLFWLDHRHPEDHSGGDDSQKTSKTNAWEVEMSAAFVRHLVRQGEYSPTDIALLTPYAGQLQKLRSALSRDFEIFLSDRDRETLALEGLTDDPPEEDEAREVVLEKKQLSQTIRLATVDNFQGEEAKVIIVSLVRSNDSCKVGFLRTENRINVLLSRAQHGMYLIGNSDTYRHVAMWADVQQQLREMEAIGDSVALCCPRHPDTPISCAEPDDFVLHSPEGGCSLTCDQRLERCGHRCEAKCHSTAMHEAFSCCQPCPRIRETCDHQCPGLCGERCRPCVVLMDGVRLPCGHVRDKLECHKTIDLSSIRCSVQVEKEVPGCGHVVAVRCSEDVGSARYRCPTACGVLLKCGHPCPGSCGTCRKEEEGGSVELQHQECKKVCARPRGTCNHLCPKRCHDGEDCEPCANRCEVRCPHSACPVECQKPCAPCIERCTWSCEHRGSCSLPCAAPCDRLPCDERCPQLLPCGHQCPGFCGEECPQSLCQICCTRRDARVDLLEFRTYEEIDLDETPIAVLGCGHFFTGETLDGLVGMNEVYTTDSAGQYNGLKDVSAALARQIPSCPDCKRPIRQFATKRYNRVVNRAVMDETSKRFLVGGRRQLDELSKAFEKALKRKQSQLKTYRFDPDNANARNPFHSTIVEVQANAQRLRKNMDVMHQPAKRLLDAMVTLHRQGNPLDHLQTEMNGLSISEAASGANTNPPYRPVYDQQITLGAYLIELRVFEIFVQDKFNDTRQEKCVASSVLTSGAGGVKLNDFFEACQSLIAEASKAKLPRLVISASLSFAKISQLYSGYRRAHASVIKSPPKGIAIPGDQTETARELLATALELCDGLPDNEELRAPLVAMMRLYEGPKYETVTPEEIEAIKTAMVSGAGGIMTHSGHWYNCANGHPFAIGECGMPMEEARCPECGAHIGGQNHVLVEGATRATQMEGN
ncbi:hypothetical protein B0T17DRAFT_639113 [Bombardia bombarda]|uniref:NFX1-type zinc finger-containing protein 1 n=1 Tax=Bombardia bombarda TaxID=252184 RepID=A0AA39X0Y2_9PEZI|nr:hypothetical protein B0T17DRAFT_639113 [Bombardia bombarda]